MPFTCLPLCHFLQPTPVCSQSDGIDRLVAVARDRPSAWIAVVGARGEPLGAIAVGRLLACLWERSQRPSALGLPREAAPQISSEEWLSQVETMEILPADLPLGKVWLQLVRSGDRPAGLVDEDGRFLGLVDRAKLLQAIGSDFNARSPSEAEIGADRFWVDILDRLPVPLILQSETGQVLYQNPRWQEEIGASVLPDTAPIASDPDSLSLAAQLSCTQWLENRAKATPPPKSSGFAPPDRYPVNLSAPEKVWQFIRCPLASDAWNAKSWLIVGIDVTASHQLCQELMAKNEDLAQLNRLKDEFFAGISHEFKSPVTAIVGLANLFRDRSVVNLEPRQQQYVDLIYENGRQLMALVNDLLDLSCLETGQFSLDLATVSVRDLCERAWTAFIRSCGDRAPARSQFTLDIAPDIDRIVADELRATQILANLLDNAWKACATGDRFGLRVMRRDRWLMLTVWDAGKGVPDFIQPYLFDRPPSPTKEGTGLGLVLARRLARAHGGDISFVSQEGSGSQFTLLLPDGSPLDSARDRGKTPPVSAHWVLIAEANAESLDPLLAAIEKAGYCAAIARTGIEAVDKARCLQPSAIFINPHLPTLSGWDALTLIASAPETQHIPTILLGSDADRLPHQTFHEDAILDFPVNPQAIAALLNQWARPEPPSPPLPSLTLLRLSPEAERLGRGARDRGVPLALDPTHQLSQLQHRILEADDLDQAEMLAQVWEVDVVVMDGRALTSVKDYLDEFCQYPYLSSLPLVVLDLATAEAANRRAGLSVFPCLLPENDPKSDRFWQVLQVAAGLGET